MDFEFRCVVQMQRFASLGFLTSWDPPTAAAMACTDGRGVRRLRSVQTRKPEAAQPPDSRRIFAVANNAIDAFGLVVECQISD
jgi:hypothetical protein